VLLPEGSADAFHFFAQSHLFGIATLDLLLQFLTLPDRIEGAKEFFAFPLRPVKPVAGGRQFRGDRLELFPDVLQLLWEGLLSPFE